MVCLQLFYKIAQKKKQHCCCCRKLFVYNLCRESFKDFVHNFRTIISHKKFQHPFFFVPKKYIFLCFDIIFLLYMLKIANFVVWKFPIAGFILDLFVYILTSHVAKQLRFYSGWRVLQHWWLEFDFRLLINCYYNN